jgi:BirA family transcriptional regulator, biotin operon repressor / biotin---[acetyl-CoA-carboxylase] ligase
VKDFSTNCGLLIFDFEDRKIAEPLDPEILAASSDLWAKDVDACAPWEMMDNPDQFGMPKVRVWRSGRGEGRLAVILCGPCGSCMDIAWRLIDQKQLNPWDSVLAVSQIAGRGQYQRNWISPAGNIHAAWQWPDPGAGHSGDVKWRGLIPLVAGYMLSEVFKGLGLSVRVKWPNDLLIEKKKFGGILVETRTNKQVVGIGINIAASPDDPLLRNDFALPATHLRREGFEATPLDLWLRLVEGGKAVFERVMSGMTPEEFVAAVSPSIAWAGSRVRVKTGTGDVFTAVISGLSEDGGLRLQLQNKERILYVGSVLPE